MSDHAGIICTAADVKSSLADASALNRAIRQRGVAFEGAYEAARALAMAADGDRFRGGARRAFVLRWARRRKPGGADRMQPGRRQSPARPDRAADGISVPFRACRGSRRTDPGAARGRRIHLRHAARPPTRPVSATRSSSAIGRISSPARFLAPALDLNRNRPVMKVRRPRARSAKRTISGAEQKGIMFHVVNWTTFDRTEGLIPLKSELFGLRLLTQHHAYVRLGRA